MTTKYHEFQSGVIARMESRICKDISVEDIVLGYKDGKILIDTVVFWCKEGKQKYSNRSPMWPQMIQKPVYERIRHG